MLNGYTKQEPFRFWCQKVLPTEYDDSLSYYELLNKVVNYLNVTNENVTVLHDTTLEYTERFEELENFVNQYFDSLDVQEEINEKLNEMAENGELTELITPYMPDIIDEWLSEHIVPTSPALDDTLTLSNAAAQAKAVGDLFDKSLVYRNPTYGTSVDALTKTGLYFCSTTEEYPDGTIEGCPFAPCYIYQFLVSDSIATQMFIPYYAINARPMIRQKVGGVWRDPVDFINPNIRALIYDENTIETITELGGNKYQYRLAKLNGVRLSGIPSDIADGHAIYIERTFVSSAKNVSMIKIFNASNGYWYTSCFAYGETITQIAPWAKTVKESDLEQLDYSLRKYGGINLFSSGSKTPSTYNGITFTYDPSTYKYKVNGTATGLSFYNIWLLTNPLPLGFEVGKEYSVYMHSDNDTAVYAELFYSINGVVQVNNPIRIKNNTASIKIPENADNGCTLRITVPTSQIGIAINNVEVELAITNKTGGTGGGDINNYYEYVTYNNAYNVTATPEITEGNLYVLTDDGTQADRTNEIMTMLSTNGCCILGSGTFYVNNIVMPINSCLKGSGSGATNIVMANGATGGAIKMQSFCEVSDLCIFGGATSKPTTEGTRSGIEWAGTFDGNTSLAAGPYRGQISNLKIYGFNKAGILCRNSSMLTSTGVNAVNVNIYRCYSGISIPIYSEYNRFTNIEVDACTYGAINGGGNNQFCNCGFNSCNTCFSLLGEQPNSTHSVVSCCSFNHAEPNNAGTSIKAHNVPYNYTFVGCQIHYGIIDIKDSNGINFVGCNFGRGITYNIDNSVVTFNANTFGAEVTNDNYNPVNSPVVISNNCSLYDGTTVEF